MTADFDRQDGETCQAWLDRLEAIDMCGRSIHAQRVRATLMTAARRAFSADVSGNRPCGKMGAVWVPRKA
jgi:hypothetical protein